MTKKIHIKEKSWVARLASWKLRNRATAIVFGNSIYLYKINRENFLKDEPWLKHELKHIEQYQRLGTIRFLSHYFIDWIKNGYHNNKFEIEARAAEKEDMPAIKNYID